MEAVGSGMKSDRTDANHGWSGPQDATHGRPGTRISLTDDVTRTTEEQDANREVHPAWKTGGRLRAA